MFLTIVQETASSSNLDASLLYVLASLEVFDTDKESKRAICIQENTLMHASLPLRTCCRADLLVLRHMAKVNKQHEVSRNGSNVVNVDFLPC